MMRGWYSEEQRRDTGTVVYLSVNGREVICTEIRADGNPSLWPDAADIGEVISFVRREEFSRAQLLAEYERSKS